MLTPGRIAMINLDSVLESRDIILLTKVHKSKLWLFQQSCIDVSIRPYRSLSAEELMLLNCGVGTDSWESLGLQGNRLNQSILNIHWNINMHWYSIPKHEYLIFKIGMSVFRKSILNIQWKDWCWNSNTLAPWCKEPIHLKIPGAGKD